MGWGWGLEQPVLPPPLWGFLSQIPGRHRAWQPSRCCEYVNVFIRTVPLNSSSWVRPGSPGDCMGQGTCACLHVNVCIRECAHTRVCGVSNSSPLRTVVCHWGSSFSFTSASNSVWLRAVTPNNCQGAWEVSSLPKRPVSVLVIFAS